jgi:phenylalanine-4-hydroxylase
MAAMMEHVGHVGLEAIAAGRGELVARLYWHTVEFGLAREAGEVKILGAGLASSFGESRFSLESAEVERPRFTLAGAMATPYRHDAFQPLYMVADSLDEVTSRIAALSMEDLEALAA